MALTKQPELKRKPYAPPQVRTEAIQGMGLLTATDCNTKPDPAAYCMGLTCCPDGSCQADCGL